MDLFWVSDKTKDTLTIGTIEDFQELRSPGSGEIRGTSKDEVLISLPFNKYTIELILYPVQKYGEGEVKKGEPIGFALDGHVEIQAIKIANKDYAVNPLSILFVHKHQAYTSSVPFATPKTLI